MTDARSPLADPALVAALYQVHAQLDAACRAACDIGLETCSVLADIVANGQGLAVKQAAERYRVFGEIAQFEHLLRERELITLARFPRDRRALAYLASPKGVERLALADQVLGSCLVAAHPSLTEESLDKLVGLFYAYAEACGEEPVEGCLFPACILRALGAHRQLLMTVAARFGMTSAQMAVLALLHAEAPRPMANTLAAQVQLLQDRDLVEVGEPLRLAEAGQQRLTEFMKRLNTAMTTRLSDVPAKERAALADLLYYVRYLFA